ncbi:MAG: YfcE family phosphodiesterase [Oscillospiraceae bacterium]|nr:YfcE family phosphodiesterase [Oscillospiraceae bacterium]
MRILVVSDSHRNVFLLRLAIERHRDASVVIHLGDGEDDMNACLDLLTGMKTVQARGNCDYGSAAPESALEIIGGKRVYCTHGSAERVKYGDSELRRTAEEHQADIILYGHTHQPVHRYQDGAHFFNPGSVHANSYGVVDITPAGIVCIHQNIL